MATSPEPPSPSFCPASPFFQDKSNDTYFSGGPNHPPSEVEETFFTYVAKEKAKEMKALFEKEKASCFHILALGAVTAAFSGEKEEWGEDKELRTAIDLLISYLNTIVYGGTIIRDLIGDCTLSVARATDEILARGELGREACTRLPSNLHLKPETTRPTYKEIAEVEAYYEEKLKAILTKKRRRD